MLHIYFLLKCPYSSYNESFKMIRIHWCGGLSKTAPETQGFEHYEVVGAAWES